MLRIAILASTRATDSQRIIDEINNGVLKGKAKIEVFICDKKNAYALERAKNNNIEGIFLDPKNFKNREEYDEEILKILKQKKIDLVLLIGYMRILTKKFIEEYRNRIMNIHPSLLPAFSGGMDLNVHKEVLKYGCKVTGCTLHFADENVDSGPIIIQKVCNVEENDNEETLKEKVQKLEQDAFIEAIKLFEEGKIKVEGRKVIILR